MVFAILVAGKKTNKLRINFSLHLYIELAFFRREATSKESFVKHQYTKKPYQVNKATQDISLSRQNFRRLIISARL